VFYFGICNFSCTTVSRRHTAPLFDRPDGLTDYRAHFLFLSSRHAFLVLLPLLFFAQTDVEAWSLRCSSRRPFREPYGSRRGCSPRLQLGSLPGTLGSTPPCRRLSSQRSLTAVLAELATLQPTKGVSVSGCIPLIHAVSGLSHQVSLEPNLATQLGAAHMNSTRFCLYLFLSFLRTALLAFHPAAR